MFFLRYFVKCAKCSAEALLATFQADENSRTYVPTLPPGWAEGTRTKFYCPAHQVTVTITIDGVAS
jgi:hypothetical protein